MNRRFLAGIAALSLGLVGTGTGVTHASTMICRTDPIVMLSTGAQLDITDSVQASSSTINSITYTLHIPSGQSVTRIVYTSGMSSKEKLTWVADQANRTYNVSTKVGTGKAYSMTEQVTLTNSQGNVAGSGSASGTTNATLAVGFVGSV